MHKTNNISSHTFNKQPYDRFKNTVLPDLVYDHWTIDNLMYNNQLFQDF